AEGDNMTFDMVNNGDIFGLDARNGKLVVNDDLDFETTQSYTLKVSVSDGELSATADITVNVTDVDEGPAIADQTFSVAEDAATGIVVGTVKATGDNLTFSITSGNTGDVFAIAGSTGAITVAGALDFETSPTYTLKVSVSDGTLSDMADITINVTDVDEAAPGDRLPAKDINALTAAGNENPEDIWSDGTTMWVADGDDVKLYAYILATGERDTAKEFDLDAENDRPQGIWSDRTTIWVVDWGDEKLYAYTLATGERDTNKEFDLDRGHYGLWSDGTTIWVADRGVFSTSGGDDKLYAYTLATGERDDAKDIDLVADNAFPDGLWSDDTTIWVADFYGKLYAYTLATGERDTAKEFDLDAENDRSQGIWSDGTIIWVAEDPGVFDLGDDKLYAYQLK
ncbi:MAG: cadherin domain-containing protein, partial [Ekhidna sp.]|nr:cadherin domain-containing protein [Ekhidna sp.]